jgi:hypothetical protein
MARSETVGYGPYPAAMISHRNRCREPANGSEDSFRLQEFCGTKSETETGIVCGDPASGIHRKSVRSRLTGSTWVSSYIFLFTGFLANYIKMIIDGFITNRNKTKIIIYVTFYFSLRIFFLHQTNTFVDLCSPENLYKQNIHLKWEIFSRNRIYTKPHNRMGWDCLIPFRITISTKKAS